MTDRFPDRILLATDGSEDAAAAARAASDLAARTGSDLYVVHVWNIPATVSPAVMPVDLFESGAREVLDIEVTRAKGEGVKVAEAMLIRGHPVDEILDLAEEIRAGLIVVGSRGRGTFRRMVLGSVSEAVVHHAACPVLVVRGGEEGWPPKRVVIGDDGSKPAGEAGELAARIGKLFGTGAILVRAMPEPALPVELPEYEQDLRDRLIEDGRRLADRALDERAGELGALLGARPETEPVLDDAATAILEAAGDERSTLVAVGSRGLGVARRMVLGSVSTKVLRAAKGPVLIYPQTGE